jgi:hypothetical protein
VNFDLRTFAIRAYPLEKIDRLRLAARHERLYRLAQAIAVSIRPKSIGNRQEAPHC